jgi:hypothetical protein
VFRVTLLVLLCGLCGPEAWPSSLGPGHTSPVLTRLYSHLGPLFQRHYPQVTSQQEPDGIQFVHDTRTFLIHTALKTGEWQEAREVRGPKRRGILCSIRLREGRYDGAAVLPQTFDERYFQTLVMAVPSPDQAFYLYVHLSYPDTVSSAFLKDFDETLQQAWASER